MGSSPRRPIHNLEEQGVPFCLTFDLSGLGDPASSYATASIALRIKTLPWLYLVVSFSEIRKSCHVSAGCSGFRLPTSTAAHTILYLSVYARVLVYMCIRRPFLVLLANLGFIGSAVPLPLPPKIILAGAALNALYCNIMVGQDSSVGTPTRYGAGRSGDRIPVGGEIFRACPDRPWGPPSFLYIRYRVFPGGKAAGAWRWPRTTSSAEAEGIVELYFYFSSGPSWSVLGWTLPHFTFNVVSCMPVPVATRSKA